MRTLWRSLYLRGTIAEKRQLHTVHNMERNYSVCWYHSTIASILTMPLGRRCGAQHPPVQFLSDRRHTEIGQGYERAGNT